MLPHDRLDGFRCLICVIEWDCGNIVMKNVCFDNAVKKLAANKTKLAIYRSSSTTGVGPGMGLIMRKRRVSMLEVGDGDFEDG